VSAQIPIYRIGFGIMKKDERVSAKKQNTHTPKKGAMGTATASARKEE